MTFRQDDVDNLKGFLQFVADRAVFRDLDWADAIQLTRYREFSTGLLRRINAHVMELRSVVDTNPEGTE